MLLRPRQDHRRERLVDLDEIVRPETTVETLASLKPAFYNPAYEARFPQIQWEITPGNSSPLSDGSAAVPLMWQRETGGGLEKLNPCGGAIALGHPLGASGARLMATMLNSLERTGGRYGLQTMCEAGGMAYATIIERI